MTDKPNRVSICIYCGAAVKHSDVGIEEAHRQMMEHDQSCEANPLVAKLATGYWVDTSMLSERHIKALDFFVKKFIAGAIAHGDLQTGKKWTKDKLEERVDGTFYDIFDLLEALEEDEL